MLSHVTCAARYWSILHISEWCSALYFNVMRFASIPVTWNGLARFRILWHTMISCSSVKHSIQWCRLMPYRIILYRIASYRFASYRVVKCTSLQRISVYDASSCCSGHDHRVDKITLTIISTICRSHVVRSLQRQAPYGNILACPELSEWFWMTATWKT